MQSYFDEKPFHRLMNSGWTTNLANTIDEQRVLDELEAASDYERGLERLGEDGKAQGSFNYR